jgi:hypothetical protein
MTPPSAVGAVNRTLRGNWRGAWPEERVNWRRLSSGSACVGRALLVVEHLVIELVGVQLDALFVLGIEID